MSQETDFNTSGSKYLRQILLTARLEVDVYAVLDAFNVTCPASQHAIKKLLCAGIRGKGDVLQDLREAADATSRAIQMEEQRQSAISPARYAAIHTPLPAEEVAAISEGVGKEGVDNCANYDPDTCDYSDCRHCASYEREIPTPTPPSLCTTCAKAAKTCPIWPVDIVVDVCLTYAAKTHALDLSLPYIVLECSAGEAHRKYLEERAEWQAELFNSPAEVIEMWDVLQSAQTWLDRIDVRFRHSASEAYKEAERELRDREGINVMAHKPAFLLKNALRQYYDPKTCAIIIASGGTRWK